jgi:hypothetical protein
MLMFVDSKKREKKVDHLSVAAVEVYLYTWICQWTHIISTDEKQFCIRYDIYDDYHKIINKRGWTRG